MNTEKAVQHFRELTEKELVEALYEVFATRELFSEESEWSENKLVVCNARRELDENDQWTDWQLQLLAQDDKEEYPDGWSKDALICQEGVTVANIPIFSWAKKIKCPITGKKVYGT